MNDSTPTQLWYQEQLKDIRWRVKRKEIIDRDAGECQHCKTTEKLHVHHTYYTNYMAPWEYPDDMLITLCEDCHEEEHLRSSAIKERARTQKMCDEYCKEDSPMGDIWRIIRDVTETIKSRSM